MRARRKGQEMKRFRFGLHQPRVVGGEPKKAEPVEALNMEENPLERRQQPGPAHL